MITMIMLW